MLFRSSGVISGSGNLKVSGGTLTLTGTNTYTGTTTLSSGSIRFNSDRAFGAVPGSLNTAAIVLQGTSAGFYAMSDLTWNTNRGITNNMSAGSTMTFGADGGITWTIGNAITAGGSVGANQNLNISCYSGCTDSSRSTIVLNGSFDYSGSTTVDSRSIYQLTQANQIPDTSALSLDYYSQLNLAGSDETVGSLASGYTT